jgi:hypothetical protein
MLLIQHVLLSVGIFRLCLKTPFFEYKPEAQAKETREIVVLLLR